MSQRLRLAIRKQLVEELATEFDRYYVDMVRREESLFDDPPTRAAYPDITFSTAAMAVGCGLVRLARNRCDFVEDFVSTKAYTDCVVLGSGEYHVPLPRCQRSWMLRARPGPSCPPEGDCTICSLLEARHVAALQRLEREIASGATRFVAIKVLIQAPMSGKMWDAFDRGEVWLQSCQQLKVKHAAALIIDTVERVVWMCESELVTAQTMTKVEELATMLGMQRADVHPLCRPYQSTPKGRLKIEWCMLYSQALALALASHLTHAAGEATATTPDAFLDSVFSIMHAYIRRVVTRRVAAPATGFR